MSILNGNMIDKLSDKSFERVAYLTDLSGGLKSRFGTIENPNRYITKCSCGHYEAIVYFEECYKSLEHFQEEQLKEGVCIECFKNV